MNTTTIGRPFRRRGLAACLLAGCLMAASAADAADWTLDPARSRLGFSGTQTGVKFKGRFTRYAAQIVFDPDRLDASHITVTVDLASAATGDTQRDTALPGKDWFDVADFPQAKFETTTIRRQGASTYKSVGQLTIRGVTMPVALTFALQRDGSVAHAVGHADLVRSAFGIGQGAWASGQWVALPVDVDLDIVATRRN